MLSVDGIAANVLPSTCDEQGVTDEGIVKCIAKLFIKRKVHFKVVVGPSLKFGPPVFACGISFASYLVLFTVESLSLLHLLFIS